MPTIRLPNNWNPRAYQLPSWRAWERGCKREVLIWHRRAGKDDVQLHKAAVAGHERIGNYWHCLPMYEQARKAIWEAINPHTGKRRIDEAFPPELRDRTDSQSMTIGLKSGSIWKVVGSDNPNSLVGAPPVGLTFSEWALSNPSAWGYLAPILLENNGWASFITTPRGRNHAHKMLELAKANPFSASNPRGWFSEVLTPTQTGFSLDLIEEQRKEYHALFGEDAGDALIEQEYWCSFEAAILGSYYGKLIAQAQLKGRITKVPYDPALPVHTVWDLGKGANMAIWLFQVSGNQIRVIGCIEGAHDEVIPDCVAKLEKLPYKWGNDYVPHDAKAIELGTGKTRVERLKALGRKPVLVPDHKVDDGISAARLTIPVCWFDEEACADGLEALRQYRAEWDDDKKCFRDTPLHDWTSHFADAFRYLAMAWRVIKADPPAKPEGRTIHKMTLDEAWKLREPDRSNRI